jgi:hypothetical protein
MIDILQLKVEQTIQECGTHLRYLTGSAEKLTPAFPLSCEAIESLNDETVTLLDQFIYRFTKLQDSLGTRLFPLLVSVVTGNDEVRPFADTLNQLEKIGILQSVEAWQELRTLRNNLAHEYPNSTEQRAITLNVLFVKWTDLSLMFNSAKKYYEEKILPLSANEPKH